MMIDGIPVTCHSISVKRTLLIGTVFVEKEDDARITFPCLSGELCRCVRAKAQMARASEDESSQILQSLCPECRPVESFGGFDLSLQGHVLSDQASKSLQAAEPLEALWPGKELTHNNVTWGDAAEAPINGGNSINGVPPNSWMIHF